MTSYSPQRYLLIAALALSAVLIAGCGNGLPSGVAEKNQMTMAPQDRIAAIQANPDLSDAEKARRIEFVKQKNNIK
jgi:hypothetical protein